MLARKSGQLALLRKLYAYKRIQRQGDSPLLLFLPRHIVRNDPHRTTEDMILTRQVSRPAICILVLEDQPLRHYQTSRFPISKEYFFSICSFRLFAFLENDEKQQGNSFFFTVPFALSPAIGGQIFSKDCRLKRTHRKKKPIDAYTDERNSKRAFTLLAVVS